MRLINADAVCKTLESYEIKETIGKPLTDWEYGYNCGIERAKSEIECAPTVDAEPVRHGRWIFHRMDEDENGLYECSECHRGETHSPNVVVRYCWNCGARMDGEEEGKKNETD